MHFKILLWLPEQQLGESLMSQSDGKQGARVENLAPSPLHRSFLYKIGGQCVVRILTPWFLSCLEF